MQMKRYPQGVYKGEIERSNCKKRDCERRHILDGK